MFRAVPPRRLFLFSFHPACKGAGPALLGEQLPHWLHLLVSSGLLVSSFLSASCLLLLAQPISGNKGTRAKVKANVQLNMTRLSLVLLCQQREAVCSLIRNRSKLRVSKPNSFRLKNEALPPNAEVPSIDEVACT